MQMTETLSKLKDLQDVLVTKYSIEAKMDELPKSLSGSLESLEQFKKEYIEKNAEFEAEKEKLTALKADLADAEKEREAGEKGMDNISTHREYELLDKQISEAQEHEAEIRKEIVKEEKIIAELEDLLQDNLNLIKSTEAEVNENKSSLDSETESYKKQIEDLEKKEADISKDLDSETIIKFQRIIRRNNEGLVAVRGNVCTGCHMILPAQFANEVRKNEKILFCPYCSRILTYEETTDESEYYSMDEAGSLSDLDDDDLIEDDEDIIEDEEESQDSSSSSMGYDE
ncbi:C4-type zinc ribbon domain-containing protein [Treponema sp.]|uniref:zinc ribbon domain-containing protein n=1 Tax=Treponema sp. TaxID=166 RepID=UPI0025D44025|nr:C4-type zinc ribbon domain-containing protein [Treponema sp.]MCR5218850.1 nucleic acid-binding protein [Treponema sp.]